MDNYLIDLINRMCEISDQKLEAGFDSSKTISWAALREAEKLDNKDFIPQLIDFISKEKDKLRRNKGYFALGYLAKNTSDISALNFLIKRVEEETDKYVVSSLLDRIANIKKPKGTDLQPLINSLKSNKWLIRHSAIQSLKFSDDPMAETALIEIIIHSEDPYNLSYANATLNNIGTLRAIPYLEKHIKSRKRDVKLSAQLAIESISKRHRQ